LADCTVFFSLLWPYKEILGITVWHCSFHFDRNGLSHFIAFFPICSSSPRGFFGPPAGFSTLPVFADLFCNSPLREPSPSVFLSHICFLLYGFDFLSLPFHSKVLSKSPHSRLAEKGGPPTKTFHPPYVSPGITHPPWPAPVLFRHVLRTHRIAFWDPPNSPRCAPTSRVLRNLTPNFFPHVPSRLPLRLHNVFGISFCNWVFPLGFPPFSTWPASIIYFRIPNQKRSLPPGFKTSRLLLLFYSCV